MADSEELKQMSDISMLTILIQASAIVKNRNGDDSLHGYLEVQEYQQGQREIKPLTAKEESNFSFLDCLANILVQETQVLAASYDDDKCFTVVTPNPPGFDSADEVVDMEFHGMDAIRRSEEFMQLNAAVIPNPDYKKKNDPGFGLGMGGPLGQIREVKGGINMWVKDDPWCGIEKLDVSTPEGLANHAESVACYLYDYGLNGSNKTLRTVYSTSFFRYLLAACWPKLHSRFCSWKALGFIQQLELKITGDELEQLLKDEDCPKIKSEIGHGDRSLADFFSSNKIWLLAMVNEYYKKLPDEVKSRLLDLTQSPYGSALTFDAFSKAAELPSGVLKLYTKDTVLDFHCLLYFSFLMAGKALSLIKDARVQFNQKSKENDTYKENYKEAIKAAEVSIRFLVYMLSSTAFRSHMDFWTEGGRTLKLILPCFEKKSDYLTFGKDRGILGSAKMGPQNAEEALEDDTTEIPPECTLPIFHRWVTIFVAHFLAKRTLEYHTTQFFLSSPNTFSKPKFKILAVNGEEYKVPHWDEFKRVIREALTNIGEEETERIIEILERRIKGENLDGERSLPDEAQRGLSLIKSFMKGTKTKCFLRMHCEAIFAALLEARHPGQPPTDELKTLDEISKTLGGNMISVSKLCCPVCWELFDVLNSTKSNNFQARVRGCHPTITKVALPETFPPAILEAMTNRFRRHLATQLRPLLSNSSTRSTRHFRNESETGYSATSSNEGAVQYEDGFQSWAQMHNVSVPTQTATHGT